MSPLTSVENIETPLADPSSKVTLENGLRVWCQPRPDSKSVVVFLTVRVGVRNEEKANNGISHYLEHMLFTGTERWDEDEIKDMIAKRGGHWNGWTGTERTMYFAEMAAQDVDIAMDWIAETVFHSIFPEEKIEKEQPELYAKIKKINSMSLSTTF